MRSVTIITIVLSMIFLSATTANAQAEEGEEAENSDVRIRLIMHGHHELIPDTLQIIGRIIPAPNLIGELAPLFYLGVRWQATSWLKLEPHIGWNFGGNSFILSLNTVFHYRFFYIFTEIDLNIPGYGGYWFALVDFIVLGWLHLGLEYEGWGPYADINAQSHGGGPNVLLRFGPVGIDLAVHIRGENGKIRADPFIRFHLFL